MCIPTRACTWIDTWTCTHRHTCTDVHTAMHIHTHIHADPCTQAQACMCTRACIHTDMRTCTCSCGLTCTHLQRDTLRCEHTDTCAHPAQVCKHMPTNTDVHTCKEGGVRSMHFPSPRMCVHTLPHPSLTSAEAGVLGGACYPQLAPPTPSCLCPSAAAAAPVGVGVPGCPRSPLKDFF